MSDYPKEFEEIWKGCQSGNGSNRASRKEIGFKVYHRMKAQLKEKDKAFKNFHKNICKAVNYFHDEKDWIRDQASLEEYIKNKLAEKDKEIKKIETTLEALEFYSFPKEGIFEKKSEKARQALEKINQLDKEK